MVGKDGSAPSCYGVRVASGKVFREILECDPTALAVASDRLYVPVGESSNVCKGYRTGAVERVVSQESLADTNRLCVDEAL